MRTITTEVAPTGFTCTAHKLVQGPGFCFQCRVLHLKLLEDLFLGCYLGLEPINL